MELDDTITFQNILHFIVHILRSLCFCIWRIKKIQNGLSESVHDFFRFDCLEEDSTWVKFSSGNKYYLPTYLFATPHSNSEILLLFENRRFVFTVNLQTTLGKMHEWPKEITDGGSEKFTSYATYHGYIITAIGTLERFYLFSLKNIEVVSTYESNLKKI